MQNRVPQSIIWIAFIVYMLLLVKFILLKDLSSFLSHLKNPSISNIKEGKSNLILVPFQTTWVCLKLEKGFWNALQNIGGNLLGFVPIGSMLPLLFLKLNTAKKAIATVFIISFCFELTQFFTGVGYCDIDDLIQNTLGGAIGFWVYNKWLKDIYSTSTKAAQE